MQLRASFPQIIAIGITLMSSTSCQSTIPSAPAASREIALPNAVTTEQVFQCAEKSINTLGKGGTLWKRNVTLRDVEAGLFETGDFPNDNIMGYRFRLKMKTTSSPSLSATVKASGPGQGDIRAEDAIIQFSARLQACLLGTTP